MIDEQREIERYSETDEELRKILESRKAEIKVIGVGGAGNNTISRLMQVGIVGAETIAINTCLLYTSPSPRDLSTSRMPSSA